MTTEIKYVHMMNDAMFKALFRSVEARGVVSGFLSNITGYPKSVFMNATYVGGELTKKRVDEKGKTADVIVNLENNKTIIVEMNQKKTKDIFRKNESYMYANYIEKKKIGKSEYPKIILININNFNPHNVTVPIQKFMMRDEEGNVVEGTDLIEYHIILENLVNPEYNDNEELQKFGRLLLANTMEELEEVTLGDEEYMEAKKRIDELMTDEDFIGYYDYAEAAERDRQDYYNTGREEGKKEIAKEFLKNGASLKLISKSTGLSLEELENLKKEIKD